MKRPSSVKLLAVGINESVPGPVYRAVRVEALLLKAFWRRGHGHDVALQCVEEATRIAAGSPFRLQYVEARASYGSCLMAMGQHAEAVPIFRDVLRIVTACNDLQTMAALYGNLGACCFHLNDVEEAIACYEVQIRHALTLRSLAETGLARTYQHLATLYWNAKRNRVRALEYISLAEAAIEGATPEAVLRSGVVTLEGTWGARARAAVERDVDLE